MVKKDMYFMECYQIDVITSNNSLLANFSLLRKFYEKHGLSEYMPHSVSHFMGLDVHDMENLGEQFVGYGGGMLKSKAIIPSSNAHCHKQLLTTPSCPHI